ncbi:hypothetical protein [Mesorhizobium temperatum]|uniref:Uncharacterized protein n=1 Tax=Mesorhizobium temperatum TaxID=241416 RepID=A0A271LH59_9HYPH|nr:hypothetical protein [Mesorhizobium temperatum]PAQ06558.1 hypothetical protein CIT26_25860 [Mesorhizobium temperatum]
MNANHRVQLVTVGFVSALTFTLAYADTPPKMKMSTDIPAQITTPDSVETRIGCRELVLSR